MSEGPDSFNRIVAALEPRLLQHGFRSAAGMDAMLAPGTCHAAFAAGGEAVRLVWAEGGGYVVMEALEPEYGSWADILLRRIDLRNAVDAERLSLTDALHEVLTLYFDDIRGA